jgi:hypothetical protein
MATGFRNCPAQIQIKCPGPISVKSPRTIWCRLSVVDAYRLDRATASPAAFQHRGLEFRTRDPGLEDRYWHVVAQATEHLGADGLSRWSLTDQPFVVSTGRITDGRSWTAFASECENDVIVRMQAIAHHPQMEDVPRVPSGRFAAEGPAQRFALSQSAIRSCASSTQQPQLPVTQ